MFFKKFIFLLVISGLILISGCSTKYLSSPGFLENEFVLADKYFVDVNQNGQTDMEIIYSISFDPLTKQPNSMLIHYLPLVKEEGINEFIIWIKFIRDEKRQAINEQNIKLRSQIYFYLKHISTPSQLF